MIDMFGNMWFSGGEAVLSTPRQTCRMFLRTFSTACAFQIEQLATNVKMFATVCQFPVPKLDMFWGLTVPSAIRLLLGAERSATTRTHPFMGDLLRQGLEEAGKRLAIDKRHRVDTGQGVQELPLCIGGK